MKNFIRFISVVSLLISSFYSYAQQPTLQDCFGAISVCNGTIINTETLSGEGNYTDEINFQSSCLNSGERNSFWIKFSIIQPGLLGVKLTPNIYMCDIDFALFNLSNATCNDIYSNPSLEVSCNFSGGMFPTPTTGLSNNLLAINGNPVSQVNPMIPVSAGETFYLLVNNFTGSNTGTVSINFSESTCEIAPCNSVSGKIYLNNDENCTLDSTDFPVISKTVSLRNIEYNLIYSGYSDENGTFDIQYPNIPGTYQYIVDVDSDVFDTCSFPAPIISLSGVSGVIDTVEIGLESLVNCTKLNILHSANILRPCRLNYRYVQAKNEGTLVATNPLISLAYNPEITLISANYPYAITGDSVVFQLPTINPFESIQIQILDSVSCDANAGDVICMLAASSIENTCSVEPNNSSFSVEVDCSLNQLKVVNQNNSDLTGFCDFYLVNEYAEIDDFSSFNLGLGDSLIRYLNSLDSGAVYIMNQEQDLIFIGRFNCENDSIMLLPNELDILQINNSLNCEIIRNSYDPNDKTGFPAGVSEENIILTNQEIKYRIRFQNTGNDTAFVVVIRDTLSQYLDPNSVRVGMSSHAFTFTRDENRLAFNFNNIYLPDSTTNEPSSHGFIDLFVKQRVGNPPSYSIFNTAHIYFDFNEAIVTNTYRYEIRDIGVGINKTEVKKSILFFPNPSNGILYINAKLDKNVYLKVYNLQGKLVGTVFPDFNKNTFELPHTLVNGIYFLVSTSKDIPPQKIILNR